MKIGFSQVAQPSTVKQPSSTTRGSVEFDVNLETMRLTNVIITSTTRPITAYFYNGSGVLLHTISHPASATTSYNVTAQAIPVTEQSTLKSNGETKYKVRLEYVVHW